MTTSKMSEVIQHLRRAVLLGDGAGLTDRQLLDSYISGREEAAIGALVRRHGPMVWAVCHRVLHNHHDTEDAFQATFLVLVRKAASIVSKEMLANWLYGVAHQTALRAKLVVAKRRGRERQVFNMPEPKGVDQDRSRELQLLLDQELSRLPDKYRAVIVLCDLQGKTRKEAARQLGVPEGTIASRMATARTKLAKRLARHGLALGGGSLAVALSQSVASASVPTGVLSSTIKAVTLVAAGKAATGLISANVAALTEGVMKAMLLTKLKTMMALLLLLSMVAFTSVMVLAWGQTGPASTGDKSNSGVKPAAKAEKQAAQAQPKDPPKDFTNSIGMKFVWIPPGSFMMGSPQEEKEAWDDALQHKVTLTRGFYMAVHVVTQEQWQGVMGNNPAKFQGEKKLPVEQVSWNECQEFIKKLREKDKKAYRLPSEAEWEYACRAGTKTPFHFGETISTAQANYNGNFTYSLKDVGKGILVPRSNEKQVVNREKTTTVGSFPANAFGLHEMHGNVEQWCEDWYGEYPQNDVVDPQGPEKGNFRVMRGGSWNGAPQNCRSANRFSEESDRRRDDCGCRLCFFVEQEAKPEVNPKDAEADKEPPLTVTIKSQKNPIRHRESFKVDLRVVNPSKSPQSFQVMNCSWYQHWISTTEMLFWDQWECEKNFAVTVKLAPGEAYEKTLPVLPCLAKPQKKLSFKMGFTPIGSKQTYWSNEIILQVNGEDKPPPDKQPPAEKRATSLGKFSKQPEELTYSTDGKWLVVGAGSSVHVLDPATGNELRNFRALDKDPIGTLALSANGHVAVAGGIGQGDGQQKHMIHIWDANTGKPVRSFPAHHFGTTYLCCSTDGKVLAGVGSNNDLTLKIKGDREGWQCIGSAGTGRQPFLGLAG